MNEPTKIGSQYNQPIHLEHTSSSQQETMFDKCSECEYQKERADEGWLRYGNLTRMLAGPQSTPSSSQQETIITMEMVDNKMLEMMMYSGYETTMKYWGAAGKPTDWNEEVKEKFRPMAFRELYLEQQYKLWKLSLENQNE